VGDPVAAVTDRSDLAERDYCYLTTTGRRTGHPHTIEIWFAVRDDVLYLLSGNGDQVDWVKNLLANPTVGLRLGEQDMITQARVVTDEEEDALARRLLLDKYAPRSSDPLTEWAATALPIAIAIQGDVPPD
jgi:deazaflavin-dependent oxidoreductase (nitroreductase family)